MAPSTNECDRRAALDQIIANESMYPVFQPIVSLEDGGIIGMETLTRLEDGAPITRPDHLFDAATEHSRLWDLESITRRKSLAAASSWPSGRLLFINCSPEVLADERFVEGFKNAVESHPTLCPQRIVIEITERSNDQMVDGLADQIDRLKSQGFQVAIDDVGAGTSGLNRIMMLRPHWLKLDRELIDNIDSDPIKKNLVRVLLNFCRLSGVRLLAEGIERTEELDTLMDIGVSYAQGYLLAKPARFTTEHDDDIKAKVDRAWERRDSMSTRQADEQSIGGLVRSAAIMGTGTTIGEGAAEILKGTEPGFIIREGTHIVGWCDRDRVLRAASDGRAPLPLNFLVTGHEAPLASSTTLIDALDSLAARPPAQLGTPIIVAEGGHVRGVVHIGDLLHAAAMACRFPTVRTSPLTGLPGRVACDMHVSSRAHDARFADTPCHAVIFNICSLKAFNEAFGYETGDELILELMRSLQSSVARLDQDAFIGHLGDDTFLVTSDATNIAEFAQHVVDAFQRHLQEMSLQQKGHGVSAVWLGATISKIGPGTDVAELLGQSRRRERDPSMPLFIATEATRRIA